MSRRGLAFLRDWADRNVDAGMVYPYCARRAALFATQCEQDARAASIGCQEIEDEVGDLEQAFLRLLQRQDDRLWG
jgi:hypothetical protein